MSRFALIFCAVAGFLAGCSPDSAPPSRPPFTAAVMTTGRSMLPTFAEHEVVRLEMCRYDELKQGETVIYWHSESRQWIHHRLDHRNETGRWVTRGDNNPGNDRGVMTSDEFVGRTHKLI